MSIPKTGRHRLPALVLAVVLAGSTLALAGCPRAQRSPGPRTQTPATPGPGATTATGDAADRINQWVKGLGVPNFRRADTIIVGNVAVIGLDLAPTTAPGTTTAPGATPTPSAPATPGGPTTTPVPGGATLPAPTPGAPGTAGTPSGVMTGDPASMVASRIVAANVGVTSALVTTDPALVSQIASIAAEMRSGRPATDRIGDIARIVERLRRSSPAGGTAPGAGTAPGTP